jgi:hypothetical protein
MELEERIRSQIEAILVNDARNYSEIKKMAEDDEPLDASLPDEERNLYHRIINSYRNAVNEVNKLLEESIESLSAYYRIVESIKEKRDFQEICSQVVEGLLQDFGADYCSLLFPEGDDPSCLEGIREDRKFLRIHSKTSLLGSREFELELTRMAAERPDCLKIEDIYKEPRFNAMDFPGVVRSVLCLPMLLHEVPIGFVVLSHSLPSYFQDNHIRVLRILGSFIAHLRLLHEDIRVPRPMAAVITQEPSAQEKPDVYSAVLIEFSVSDSYGRSLPLGKESVREIRSALRSSLETGESILFYGDRDLLVFMPGVSSDILPERVRKLREAFHSWRAQCSEARGGVRLSLGFSVCDGEEDLARTLEVASFVMNPDSDEV